MLYARVGKTYSPVSGNEVKRHTVSDVLDFVLSEDEGAKLILSAPLIIPADRTAKKQLEILSQQGFSRLLIDGKMLGFEDFNPKKLDQTELLVDRFVVEKENDDNNSRIMDSVQTAFFEGHGECYINSIDKRLASFSNKFELDGMLFEEPSDQFFSFNSPIGACKKCEGFGSVIGIDANLVIPDKSKSIYEDAIVCWKTDSMSTWKHELIAAAEKSKIPIHKPFFELNDAQVELIWSGNEHFEGLNAFFKFIESQTYKIQYRVMLSRYRGKTECHECNGARIRKDASYVKIGDMPIHDLLIMPIDQCLEFFQNLNLDEISQQAAKRLLIEIENRLSYLCNVGLSYLNLNRPSNTLSGGESQRINLATSLGSSLVGSMYILDEPSIGLHPKDGQKLIGVLRALQELGNTVIVVEHEEDMMREADYLIDMGPLAGSHGGEVVFAGNHKQLHTAKNSLTAQYLSGDLQIETPAKRRISKKKIQIIGARQHNLKNIDVDIPLGVITAVTGVSGSGKSTLIRQILAPALIRHFGGSAGKIGEHTELCGDLKAIDDIEVIDQNPIGKSSRSNPVTYVKAFDEIRALFSMQQLSKINGYKPSYFSLNVPGGRCDACEGLGEVKIEMQFMADVYLDCSSCNRKRYKDDILDVKFNDKNIAEVLAMTVDDAVDFFSTSDLRQTSKIVDKLKPLKDVGLGYVQLGQSSNTLSGGEAQRVKLASFLSKGSRAKKTLFIFDEPTTGLHVHDIKNLLSALNSLVNEGHSIVVIEHNPEVIKNADWVIDIGPEGGQKGGHIIFSGTPEALLKCKASATGEFLKEKMA